MPSRFHPCLPLTNYKPTRCLKNVVCILEQRWGEGNGIDELTDITVLEAFAMYSSIIFQKVSINLTLQVTSSRAWEYLVPTVSQHGMSSFKALTSKILPSLLLHFLDFQ